MSFQWSSNLHETAESAADAVIRDWLTAGGLNSRTHVLEALKRLNTTIIKRDINAWWNPPEPTPTESREPNWNAEYGKALHRARFDPAEFFGWDDPQYTLVDFDGSESSSTWESVLDLLRDMGPEHCERYETEGARYIIRLRVQGKTYNVGQVRVENGRGVHYRL